MNQSYQHRSPFGRSRPIRKFDLIPNTLFAAKNDDKRADLEQCKKQPAENLPTQWTQNIIAAKLAWVKLTHNELVQCAGSEEKLTNLIVRRYNLSTASAEQQVHRFFQQLPYRH
jgi:hypothetical protein